MILLSNGGSNVFRQDGPADRLIVGTADGLFTLTRSNPDRGWRVAHQAMVGAHFGAVTQFASGTLIAASHGLGVARSTNGGESWEWSNDGLTHFDLWAARGGMLQGRDVALVGSMPAYLMMNTDDGRSWSELPAMRQVASTGAWTFPPPPRLGHVKDIVIDGDRLFVGIEIGALLVSDDFGRSFKDLRIDPDPTECDVHHILIDPSEPQRMLAAVGLVGIMRSADGGTT